MNPRSSLSNASFLNPPDSRANCPKFELELVSEISPPFSVTVVNVPFSLVTAFATLPPPTNQIPIDLLSPKKSLLECIQKSNVIKAILGFSI